MVEKPKIGAKKFVVKKIGVKKIWCKKGTPLWESITFWGVIAHLYRYQLNQLIIPIKQFSRFTSRKNVSL